MYRLLLIRPEQGGLTTAEETVLCRFLTDNGFTVKVSSLGGIEEGIDSICLAFDRKPPHLLVVDLTAPGAVASGVLPLRHLHRIQKEAWGDETPLLPLIALLPRTHLNSREWFSFADDFLLPPHAPDELVGRVRLLLFRRQFLGERDALRFGEVTLLLKERQVLGAGGVPLSLTPREFDLLSFLLSHNGRFFSRERLLDFVWGIEYSGGPRTVDIHVRRLRAKLPPRIAVRLENRRGVGYGFTSLNDK